MGADMLVTLTKAPQFAPGNEPLEDEFWDKALRIAYERLDAIDFSEWEPAWLVEFSVNLGAIDWGFGDDVSGDGPNLVEVAKALRAHIRETLPSILTRREYEGGVTYDTHREVTDIVIDGRMYWVTGGMSSGDYPTDIFPFISALDELQIFEELM